METDELIIIQDMLTELIETQSQQLSYFIETIKLIIMYSGLLIGIFSIYYFFRVVFND